MDWLRIHVSNLCNFKCPNCHVFELGENNLPNRVMSQEIFNQTLDQFLNVMSLMGHKKTMVSIYGGETMANKKVIKEGILRYGHSCNGIELNWVINTNASLLKEEDIIFFKEHKVELHISIDGKEEVHNISRPTHKGKGTFHMVVPALELVKKHNAPAQINSYMMPSNYLHLKDIVDIAENYGIKKIYMDQFYNLDMISHQVGMQKYREIYYYGLHKGIQIGGPWLRVMKNHGHFYDKRENLEHSLALDVNMDGTFYFPMVSETKKEIREIRDLTAFFENKGWPLIVDRARAHYDQKCEGCSIKKYCYGKAIEQVHYHIGTDADTDVSCNFFRDWITYLTRPIYYKNHSKFDLLSMIEIHETDGLAQALSSEITKLERYFKPLKKKITVNVSEFPEEFKAAARRSDFEAGKRAYATNTQLYHLGTDVAPELSYELVKMFVEQKKLNMPEWFVVGLAEWISDPKMEEALINENLKEANFKVGNDVLPGHAKALVGYLSLTWGESVLRDFIEQTGQCHFEEAFIKFGHKTLFDYLMSFQEISA